ncbi:MAG: hypothetical protein HC904_15410 [Blastochloris sp.]|nr:hypothetical protein [Blastochloris sp.]
MLAAIKNLAGGQGKDYKRLTISNGAGVVTLDAKLKQKVEYLLRDQISSKGSYQGVLDAVNLHRNLNIVWIYPEVGPTKILCHFPPGSQSRVAGSLKKMVRVFGTKFFRPNANFPHRIDVDDFEVIDEDLSKHLINLKGILKDVKGSEGHKIINGIRDEW